MRKTILLQLRKLHRYIGLSAALFVVIISLTGILINHTHSFSLDKHYIQSPVILSWYGIEQPEHLYGFQIGEHWIYQWEDTLFFSDRQIGHTDYNLVGAIKTSQFSAVATNEELWLLTLDGELIEKLTSPAEKLGDISLIGQYNDHIIVATANGNFQADNDLVAWHQVQQKDITWSELAKLPDTLSQQTLNQTHSITWERLLLDLHSGRIAGIGGVYFTDFVALILIFLALSGIVFWFGQRTRR